MADRMTFDAFRTDGGGIFTPEEAAAFAVVHAYVKRWAYAERPNGWLMLMGPYGVGKTHLAVAAAVVRRNLGDDVYFSTVANLLDHLRAAYSPDSAVAHADLLMRISSAQLLVLDDLGAERNTPFAEDKLFQIVNHRYEERLPTIITTSDRLSDIDAARPRIGRASWTRWWLPFCHCRGRTIVDTAFPWDKSLTIHSRQPDNDVGDVRHHPVLRRSGVDRHERLCVGVDAESSWRDGLLVTLPGRIRGDLALRYSFEHGGQPVEALAHA